MSRRSLVLSVFAAVAVGFVLFRLNRGATSTDMRGTKAEDSGEEAWLKEWIPETARLIEVIDLPANGRRELVISERFQWLGIQVKEGWELRERGRADGKDYEVRLERSVDHKFVGTILGAATDFGQSSTDEKFELRNNSPVNVKVAVYTDRNG